MGLHILKKTPDPKQQHTGGSAGGEELKSCWETPEEPERRLCLLLLVLSRAYKKEKLEQLPVGSDQPGETPEIRGDRGESYLVTPTLPDTLSPCHPLSLLASPPPPVNL
ncbi:hypothetical protein NQZ68_007479 [Dissostichus eleginoides]|nr:hypothetical protein NQZ68_007479 [Dissostichus eleginoides]